MTSAASQSTPPIIAIIGAGPGGLLLARYLQLHSIKCTIYEREALRSVRTQGGSLDLHEESGQLAIKEVGLLRQVLAVSRREGEQTRVLDSTGKVWLDDGSDEHHGPMDTGAQASDGSDEQCWGRPEVDRTDLRNILLDSLHPDTIQWNHQLVSVDPLPSSSYQLHFDQAPSVRADILIGADGAWSRIRPLLTPSTPTYTGITIIELAISNISARFPQLASLVANGTAFIASDNKAIIPQRNSRDIVRIYASLRAPEPWLDEHPIPLNPTDAREYLVSLFPGWDATVLDLIKESDDSPIITRKIYGFPPGHSWSTQLKGITLLGDAAHLMSPFAGEGVNLALIDAYELGREIVAALGKSGSMWMDELDNRFRVFEKVMMERASEKAEESLKNLDALYSASAPVEYVEIVKSFGPPPVDEGTGHHDP